LYFTKFLLQNLQGESGDTSSLPLQWPENKTAEQISKVHHKKTFSEFLSS
jgi:hypothetical protein